MRNNRIKSQKRNLFTSEEALSSVKNDLEVVIQKVEYQQKLLEELETEGYLNVSSGEIHKRSKNSRL